MQRERYEASRGCCWWIASRVANVARAFHVARIRKRVGRQVTQTRGMEPGVSSNRHGVPAAVAFTKVVGFEPNGGFVGSISYHELMSLPAMSMPAVHVIVVCSCTHTHTSVAESHQCRQWCRSMKWPTLDARFP